MSEQKTTRKGLLVTMCAIATIILAVPVCVSYAGEMWELSKTPAQIKELQGRLNSQEIRDARRDQELDDIHRSLDRIERALRIAPVKENEHP